MIAETGRMLLMAAAAATTIGATGAVAAGDPYLWKYRPVLVFAPDDGDASLARQKQAVAAQADAFRERSVVVVYVVGDRVSRAFGPAPGAAASTLRQKYGVAAGEFHAILVGKDGGVKLQSRTPLSAERLSKVIDAMPMRRDEMRGDR
jgi:Domain of unknown function (DUF4174)